MQVNGKMIRKGTSCVLNSGDEVVFGVSGNHAYVSITSILCAFLTGFKISGDLSLLFYSSLLFLLLNVFSMCACVWID